MSSGTGTTPKSSPQPIIITPRALVQGSVVPRDILVLARAALTPTSARGLLVITSLRSATAAKGAPSPPTGKSTALEFLAKALDLPAFDEEDAAEASDLANRGIILLACGKPPRHAPILAVLTLTPWDLDDCLAYAAQRSRPDVPRVLAALQQEDTLVRTLSSPDLLVERIDHLVKNPHPLPLGKFLASLIDDQLSSEARRLLADHWRVTEKWSPPPDLVPGIGFNRWWRHGVVREAFFARWIAEQLACGETPEIFDFLHAQTLLPAIADAAAEFPAAAKQLGISIANNPRDDSVPLKVTLLLKMDPHWRPVATPHLNLQRALIRNAQWAGIDLSHANLRGADFVDCDLSAANLSGVLASKATFRRSKLAGAILRQAELIGSGFAKVDASAADFSNAIISESRFETCTFTRAKFVHTELTRSKLLGCDFSHCLFSNANLAACDLTASNWHFVSFAGATLHRANLEEMTITAANFSSARLNNAFLTGSKLHHANFADADLTSTGLADIDWTGANLAGANLTKASFHLGSSRSGLVPATGTPPNPASEGTRTGFYTDDFNDQDFKAPEEIRKACLVDADLTGAKLAGADFYLVDLRGAIYNEEQAAHLRQTGAILTPCSQT